MCRRRYIERLEYVPREDRRWRKRSGCICMTAQHKAVVEDESVAKRWRRSKRRWVRRQEDDYAYRPFSHFFSLPSQPSLINQTYRITFLFTTIPFARTHTLLPGNYLLLSSLFLYSPPLPNSKNLGRNSLGYFRIFVFLPFKVNDYFNNI